MTALREVFDLVARFHQHRDEYSRVVYKEAQVCAEFIMPMFEALGWDVYYRKDTPKLTRTLSTSTRCGRSPVLRCQISVSAWEAFCTAVAGGTVLPVITIPGGEWNRERMRPGSLYRYQGELFVDPSLPSRSA